MRVLSPVFSFVIWLLALAAGAALLAGAIYPRILSDVLPGFLYEHGVQRSFRAAVGLAGVILVLMVMLRLGFIMSRQERQPRSVSFSSSLGAINVSLETVEAFLARGASALPEVKKLAAHVTPSEDRKSVRVDVTVSVYHGRNVRELGERIQHYIADSTRELLGLGEVGDVNVTVREVIGGEPGSRAEDR